MYTNIKTGQTSSERPEFDPYFVETDLFLNFTPEESEALSEVGPIFIRFSYIGGAPRIELLSPYFFVVVLRYARLNTETSRLFHHTSPQYAQWAVYGTQKKESTTTAFVNEKYHSSCTLGVPNKSRDTEQHDGVDRRHHGNSCEDRGDPPRSRGEGFQSGLYLQ